MQNSLDLQKTAFFPRVLDAAICAEMKGDVTAKKHVALRLPSRAEVGEWDMRNVSDTDLDEITTWSDGPR